MSISSHWNAKSPRQSEIRQFQIVVLVNQKVLWFEVAVKDAVGMAIKKT